ncbi:DUF4333 domain-containing protein [Nodosilinea sp. LEGE 06152]|uniref:DUF4333 domain-containing protein n=1 Tax=Nodosilinea sp. LEGE 06152 TaxID=2777966 RepID=UPI00187F3B29|nr:DUF4333 domain-containing protein [Nodosilinea sp. LEGE 06152]MBE9158399.1 DUF4333 domain-containing protein [Nodosilinea sp. LEGE 06152]
MDRRNPIPRVNFSPSLLGLLGLAVLGLTACGNRLDTADIEANIQADIERQGRRLSLSAVRCPSDVSRQAGAYFRCVGELDPEGTFTINVTQQDNQGNVTWEVPNSKVLLNLPTVEDTIQQELSQAFGQRALIDCGTATYRVNQPGDRFQCQVVGGLETGSSSIDSVLVRIDPDGNLSWQELQSTTAASAAVALSSASTAPAVPAQPASAPPANGAEPQAAPTVKTTAVTGPTGRVINRPYLPGDND